MLQTCPNLPRSSHACPNSLNPNFVFQTPPLPLLGPLLFLNTTLISKQTRSYANNSRDHGRGIQTHTFIAHTTLNTKGSSGHIYKHTLSSNSVSTLFDTIASTLQSNVLSLGCSDFPQRNPNFGCVFLPSRLCWNPSPSLARFPPVLSLIWEPVSPPLWRRGP